MVDADRATLNKLRRHPDREPEQKGDTQEFRGPPVVSKDSRSGGRRAAGGDAPLKVKGDKCEPEPEPEELARKVYDARGFAGATGTEHVG